MNKLKLYVLEKIINILKSVDMDIQLDIDRQYICIHTDVNMTPGINYSIVNHHAWVSIDEFLFNLEKNTPDMLLNSFYQRQSIFNWAQYYDDCYYSHLKTMDLFNNTSYINKNILYSNYYEYNPRIIKHYLLCHKANEILNQIKGNSLEEIAIKLDLMGV